MSQRKSLFYFLTFSIAVWLMIVSSGCATSSNEEALSPTPTATPEAPVGVIAARDAVLDFLRDGANECVPPANVRWESTPGEAPEGFGVYRFRASDCLMTVSYALGQAEESLYHVTLGDEVAGIL